MILIYVMIAIVVNKEKKCLKRPFLEQLELSQVHSELYVSKKTMKLLTYLKNQSWMRNMVYCVKKKKNLKKTKKLKFTKPLK